MAAILRNGKKGVSLAYVIIAAMVLLVLSGVLAAAAGRNMGLTAVSTQSRQAYLTVKSAVEFAKGEAYRRAQAGEPDDFSVRPDGNLFKAGEAKGKPDGKTVYALCTMKADGLVTVSGKVSYGNAGRSRSLGCSFRLMEDEEPVSGVGAVNSFVAAGQRYGNNNQFLNGDYSFSGNPSSLPYPTVFQKTISTSSPSFSAPEMYFLNTNTSYIYTNGGTGNTSLTADVFYFGGAVQSQAQGSGSMIRLYTYSGNRRGVVWFGHKASVKTPKGSVPMPEGAYYFEDGTNLLDAQLESRLVKIQEDELKADSKLEELSRKVAYYTENADAIVAGEKDGGVGWTEAGRMLNDSPARMAGRDVFMYADKSVYYERWRNQSSPQTYEARSIVLQYNGEQDSPFTIPRAAITFQADTLWLNGQSEDGPPDADNDGDDVFAVRQDSSVSKFIFKSSDGQKPVTLYLPHGMSVRNSNGNELYFMDSGTYTVKSGTDIFKLNEASQKNAFTKISDKIGGGSGGGSGGSDGVTAGDLKYTDS